MKIQPLSAGRALCRILLLNMVLVHPGLAQLPEIGSEVPEASIAIVGGTFLNDALIDSGLLTKGFRVQTPIGESPKLFYGEIEGVPFYYMHGHGGQKYLAGWAALYQLGVREVIGGATAGSINPVMKTYDFVVPHDFIDFNISRPRYFPAEVTKEEGLILARYVPAVDTLLSGLLYEATLEVLRADSAHHPINVYGNGVVVQAAGGRFETAAEIKAFAGMGGDVVTMNVGTEMSYARQLGLNYACLVIVSNPAEGLAPWKFSDLSEIYATLNPVSLEILKKLVPRLADLPQSGRSDADLRIHPEMSTHSVD
jgi:5'-methylthioadenosine phosphorylase